MWQKKREKGAVLYAIAAAIPEITYNMDVTKSISSFPIKHCIQLSEMSGYVEIRANIGVKKLSLGQLWRLYETELMLLASHYWLLDILGL
jgi:hypothetical protein